ncbi:MAG: hypothetical protein JWO14_2252 [Solirubrobacterales bacterium]|nr:hypothetical protein [Solirubrobacterales bacterium]
MISWVAKTIRGARKVPWAKVLAAIAWLNTEGREYWNRLTAEERREVLDLAARSRGRRSNLTNAEQGRIVDLLGKLRMEKSGR